MRFNSLKLVLSIVLGGLAILHNVNGQNLDSILVTVEHKHESLEQLFKKIEDQTQLSFIFQKPQIEKYNAITIPPGTRSIKNTLDIAFEDTLLDFKKIDGNVVVFMRPDVGQSISKVKITGTIIDNEGSSMPGVNVLVKGTTTGTSTDSNGKYDLEVNEGAILVYSFIGYKSVEISINNQTLVDIALVPDATTLQAVEVNGGYYATTQALNTGNIAKVSSEEIEKQPVVNALQALQGRLAGVEIVQTSGVPGTVMNVRIRGQNSLTPGGGKPLYVIDGVPVSSDPLYSGGRITINGMDPLNTISPENIESIELLKDAEATAIYGSRGANGVMLITTRKGSKTKDGKTNLEVSFRTGVGRAPQMELMDRKQYLSMRREAFANDNVVPSSDPGDTGSNGRLYAPDLTLWDTTRSTNWQKKLFGSSANKTQAQIALSGGNKLTSFRLHTGVYNETFVSPGDFGYKRFTSGVSVNHRSLDKKFQAVVSVNYGVDKNRLFDMNYVATALNLAPVAPALYKSDGSINWELDANGRATWYNPIAAMEVTQNNRSNNLIANAVIDYTFFECLTARVNLGFNRQATDEITKIPLTSIRPNNPAPENSTSVGKQENGSWIVEPQLVYRTTIRKIAIDALVGSTFQNRDYSMLRLIGVGYSSDKLLGSLNAADTVLMQEDTDTQYRYMGVFGRISFSWDEKYLVNLTGRRDGSSRFGRDNLFANFGALGIGWIFSKEKFIENNVKLLSFGKLRASYGTAGSDNIGDYQYLDSYQPADYGYQGVSGLQPSGLANPSYAWELTKKLETGLELGFIDNKVMFSASWFYNTSSQSLVGLPLPGTTGFSSITANIPAEILNTGIELTLRCTNVQTKDFIWTSSFNFTLPRNKLISYPGLAGSPNAESYVVGHPLGTTKVYHSLGVDPETGYYRFEDVNGDGLYNMADRTKMVSINRNFYGGLSNSLSYKSFDLSFLFEFVSHNGRIQDFSGAAGSFDSPSALGQNFSGNKPIYYLDRWQRENDLAEFQRFSTSNNQASTLNGMYTLQSDASFEDASFIRLQSASISYSLDGKWLEKLKLQGFRISLEGQNLLTFTHYRGLDPQYPGRANLPPLKVITIGVQLTL